MTLQLDKKYADLLSPFLKLFKWVGKDTANFRCPICGDSKKSKTKKRGYFYKQPKFDGLKFHCKNCDARHTFSYFLNLQNPSLHKEYAYEKFNHNNNFRWYQKKHEEKTKIIEEKFFNNSKETNEGMDNLIPLKDLPKTHKCLEYVKSRKIPFKFYDDLYYIENFKKWTNDHVIREKFKITDKPDERLVFPFFNEIGKVLGYQGRSLDKENKVKYITIKAHDDEILLYGLNRVDVDKPVYVTEGIIDSYFLPNSIAVAGSSLDRYARHLRNRDCTYIFDNEPRSKEIVKIIKKFIDSYVDKNCKIVIFPDNIKQKDLNDMILSGMSKKSLLEVINNNTFDNKLKAKLRFKQWRKI